jgi:uncharacterized pyridoxamine 5'-phosphate oxidase family protein
MESSDYHEFQMYLDKRNDKSGKMNQSVPIFEDGDPETRRFNSLLWSYKAKLWIVFEHTKLHKKRLIRNVRIPGMKTMY